MKIQACFLPLPGGYDTMNAAIHSKERVLMNQPARKSPDFIKKSSMYQLFLRPFTP